MKKIAFLVCAVITLNFSLSAQKNDLITVRSGHRILDYFPFQERYRYPEFMVGKVFFKNNVFSVFKLNYNYLLGEMEFIQSGDTLIIANKKDMKYIQVAGDTFYYDKIYLEHIAFIGNMEITLSQYYKLKEIQKKDAYGVSSAGSATQTYGSLPSDGNFYKLSANEDLIFQKIREYYLSTGNSGIIPFKKKHILQVFPQYADDIKNYLKSNDVDFSSGDDLVKLSGFIAGLKN